MRRLNIMCGIQCLLLALSFSLLILLHEGRILGDTSSEHHNYFLSAPGAVLGAPLQAGGFAGWCCCLQFTNEETEAQRGKLLAQGHTASEAPELAPSFREALIPCGPPVGGTRFQGG